LGLAALVALHLQGPSPAPPALLPCTLLQDLPALLHQAPDLSIYAENVQFVDKLSPRLGLGFPASSCSGKEAYSRLLWSLRFHRTLFFGRARLELLRMWEREPSVVCVRWSARACPRLLDSAAAPLTLDGVSGEAGTGWRTTTALTV
jgi:hypothetical protein